MRYLLILICLFFSLSTNAITIKPNAPKRYVVQPGDTLWGIANRYLVHPWEWKELWHANPNIKNPNHLYAGATIELGYLQTRPFLRVLANGTIKLSPHARITPTEDPVPPIPLSQIRPFLNDSRVFDFDVLKQAPYVLAYAGEHLLAGQGDEIYVKGMPTNPGASSIESLAYSIYRPNRPYTNFRTNEILGYKLTLIGHAELVKPGKIATVIVTDITEGVKVGDKVLMNNLPEFSLNFEPKAPSFPIRAKIIDILGDFSQGAEGLVAVINAGDDAGLQPGDVLGIYSKRRLVKDPMNCKKFALLPSERLGEVMVFRTFSKTSFALVMRSIRSTTLFDTITNP